MPIRKHLAILLASAFLATAAQAAEEKKPAEAPGAAAKSADKPKAKRHNHAAERGTGASGEPVASKPPKKPLHDHGKVHKQQ